MKNVNNNKDQRTDRLIRRLVKCHRQKLWAVQQSVVAASEQKVARRKIRMVGRTSLEARALRAQIKKLKKRQEASLHLVDNLSIDVDLCIEELGESCSGPPSREVTTGEDRTATGPVSGSLGGEVLTGNCEQQQRELGSEPQQREEKDHEPADYTQREKEEQEPADHTQREEENHEPAGQQREGDAESAPQWRKHPDQQQDQGGVRNDTSEDSDSSSDCSSSDDDCSCPGAQ